MNAKKWPIIAATLIGNIFFGCSIYIWITLITDSNYAGYITENDWQGWIILGVGVICAILTDFITAFHNSQKNIEYIFGLLAKISKKLDPPAQKIVHTAPQSAPLAPVSVGGTERPAVNYCIKCGHPKSEGAKFCELCGVKFE